uniref:Odorant binding protein 10 n=1 Tax=Xylotrechus quadripes TaxID=554073 RepID=A0A346HGN2_9CUCU|nr:odorant binding protein 10 [Xylotrechus quadripes]
MKYLFIAALLGFGVVVINGMTEKQLVAAVKVVRNVCQPKSKATDEDITKMHEGNWDIAHSAMCYMYCSLNMYKLMSKDNSLNYEGAVAQLKLLPDRYRASSEKCINQCKESAITVEDKCIAGYEIAKCIYYCSPDDYYFP